MSLYIFNSLQVDPHCSYRSTVGVSLTAAAGRFLLLYFSQVYSVTAYPSQADTFQLDFILCVYKLLCILQFLKVDTDPLPFKELFNVLRF